MAKQLVFTDEARKKLKQGVDVMAQMFERDTAAFTEEFDPTAEPGATAEATPEASGEAPADEGEVQEG